MVNPIDHRPRGAHGAEPCGVGRTEAPGQGTPAYNHPSLSLLPRLFVQRALFEPVLMLLRGRGEVSLGMLA